MSLNQIQELFNGQGIVFWLAVTAVAVGLTLLSVSIYFQLRKIFSQLRMPRKYTFKAQTPVENKTASPVQVTETKTGYEAHGFVPQPIASLVQVPVSEPILTQLLARLQSSSARLEKIHNSLDTTPFSPEDVFESGLKVSGEDVDYLFKSERS